MPTFAFAAALFALPLAATPVLLHLLYRQRSPVVLFSTLRFIKLSVQRTAARRRLQKWMLLACRCLLVGVLIWAVAQPVRKLAGGVFGGGGGGPGLAVVVVDTSYSMQLQDGGTTLLARADAAVQDLLRGPLAGAKVAVLTSDGRGPPPRVLDASAVLAGWSPLRPQAALRPLVDRVAAAVALLDRQPPGPRWVVVVSDFQGREFPHPMTAAGEDARTVLIDLHPADPTVAQSAGVTGVALAPPQPIPGLPFEAAIDVTGPAGDARPVQLHLATPDGKPLSDGHPATAQFDSSGHATVRVPLVLPAERFVALTASFTNGDAMPWDDRRTTLVEVPPRQRVAVLQQATPAPGERFVRLALDPSEGTAAEWPLSVHLAAGPAADDDVLVAPLARWPGPRTAAAARSFAAAGHTLVLLLTPGMETAWAALPAAERDDLAFLLPSPPLARPAGDVPRSVVVTDAADPLLAGLTDPKFELGKIICRRMVPLSANGNATAVLSATPTDPQPGDRTQGLLFRRPVGRGTCFTFAVGPDPAVTNLGTHPTFLPLIVRTALRPAGRSAAQNVDLGQPLTVDPLRVPADARALTVTGPAGEQYQVTAGQPFSACAEPGLYAWRRSTDPATAPPLAWSNVNLPATESDLTYRRATAAAPPPPAAASTVATSVAELSAKLTDQSAPHPQWQWPLAIVLFLLCLEALMGSWPKGWRRPSLLVPRGAAEVAG